MQAQTELATKKIDSLKITLLESKGRDSIFTAKQNYKIGELYRKYILSDSAYLYFYKAEKIFRKYNYKFETAATLFGIAVCQTYDKDYTGSESTSIEALTLLESLSETNDVKKYKAYINNNLGIVFNELGLYEESIKYHKRALELKQDLEGNFERSIGLSENNIAFTYKNLQQYELALKGYQKILSNTKLINNYPDVHVLALGNYANTLYLSKNLKQLPGLYLKALNICDSVNDTYNSIIILQHLAEYYNDFNQKDSAKYYAYKAKGIAEAYNNDDLLKSLLLISEIETGELSNKYLKDYISLSDSLERSERLNRDKFARIRYETNKIEQQNIQIAKERMWLFIISVVIVLASFLLYLVIAQRNKNIELQFKQKQQEANEEIYNLMLSQNESVEEARDLEKKRISQELHDGVLGRLFGTRLSLDSLNMSNSEEAIKTREQYIDELKIIEDDIRKVSHELNTDFVSGSGFSDIIKTLIETQTLAYNLDYELTHDDDISWDFVGNKMKIHIYRIIQETLHNIYKHAKASVVEISFKLKNNVICLTIKDNGSGFDINRAKSGIGLKNMNSRIKELNGTINITSKKNMGTQVVIEAPILQT
ncbi:tetratricopeptide repeat protein [Algibacter amylolyticus]|uniref:histidine kinase n=2 Tax=Algibacter amylolyticus TaxID=1608400 RepID=A0A5M7BEE7_9FLAO|nr:sensor histidine kinase [Algibacter amylolyticus]KAA5827956.1 tetratricopeptide repeat protein [Algibacter amylolyticus]TSJ82201.1 tetratricopeptide repeat protein [Algibacter amylolyticus]